MSRASHICSPNKLSSEIIINKRIVSWIYLPKYVVRSVITEFLFRAPNGTGNDNLFNSKIDPVIIYIRLPYYEIQENF